MDICTYVYVMYVCVYVTYGFMYTRLYTFLYMYNVYITHNVSHSMLRTLIRKKRIVINTEVVVSWIVCTVSGFMFCGSQLDLWLTARTRSDCKNTLGTTAVASRQCRKGLRQMNIICHGRWCSSRQLKKARSKLVWNITTTRDTFFISTFLKLSLKEYV